MTDSTWGHRQGRVTEQTIEVESFTSCVDTPLRVKPNNTGGARDATGEHPRVARSQERSVEAAHHVRREGGAAASAAAAGGSEFLAAHARSHPGRLSREYILFCHNVWYRGLVYSCVVYSFEINTKVMNNIPV